MEIFKEELGNSRYNWNENSILWNHYNTLITPRLSPLFLENLQLTRVLGDMTQETYKRTISLLSGKSLSWILLQVVAEGIGEWFQASWYTVNCLLMKPWKTHISFHFLFIFIYFFLLLLFIIRQFEYLMNIYVLHFIYCFISYFFLSMFKFYVVYVVYFHLHYFNSTVMWI